MVEYSIILVFKKQYLKDGENLLNIFPLRNEKQYSHLSNSANFFPWDEPFYPFFPLGLRPRVKTGRKRSITAPVRNYYFVTEGKKGLFHHIETIAKYGLLFPGM